MTVFPSDQLSGAWPQKLVVFGAQPSCIALGSELSAPLAATLDSLVDAPEMRAPTPIGGT